MTLAQKLLSTLESAAVGVPTPDLIALCGAGYRDPASTVWRVLRWLESGGLVARHTVRTGPAPKRGVCVSCKRPRALSARGACHRCYLDPRRRPTGAKVSHKVAYWSAS